MPLNFVKTYEVHARRTIPKVMWSVVSQCFTILRMIQQMI